MNREFSNLLEALRDDLAQPDFWWQIVALIACLSLAKLVSMRLKRQTSHAVGELGHGGLRRLAFPLSALLLVVLSRAVLKGVHPVNLLSIAIPLLGSMALIRGVFYVLRVTFTSAGWLASFERLFAALAWLVVALHIVGWLPDVIEVLEGVGFTVGKQRLSLWLLLQGVATVCVSLLLALWIGGAVDARLARAEGLDSSLRLVLVRLARTLLVLVAVLISLPLVGIDLTTLSVFGGAFGVGLGIGLQKIASNYVSGFIILLDRSIRIGNIITVGVDRGEVTRITTRYTVLRAQNGVESIVPNEMFIGSVVQNESLSDRRVRLSISIQVAYNADLEKAMRLMVEIVSAEPRVLADPAPQALVVSFAESGINLDVGFWIADPEAGSGQLRSNVNLALWRAFAQEGIEIPYPRRDIRVLSSTSAAPAA